MVRKGIHMVLKHKERVHKMYQMAAHEKALQSCGGLLSKTTNISQC